MPNLAIVPFELPAAPDRPLSQLKRSRKPDSAVADSAIVPFEDCASSVPPMRQLKRKPKVGAGDSLTIVPFEDPAASDRTPRQLKRNRKSSGAADSFAIVPFEETPAPVCIWSSRLRFPRITHQEHKRDRRASSGKSLAAQVAAWVEARVAAGVPEEECELPFLTHAPKMVACGLCRRCVYSHDRLKCSVAACRWVFHNSCAKSRFGFYSKRFKCPQHACFLCKTNYNWRCVRCTVASHTKCAPWPDEVFYLTKPGRAAGRAVCWRHSTDWRHEEEAFSRLALPYVDGEFTIDSILKDVMENTTEPAPYVHIKRNLYLMKKKRDCDQSDVGCTNCNSNSTCSEECECRLFTIYCLGLYMPDLTIELSSKNTSYRGSLPMSGVFQSAVPGLVIAQTSAEIDHSAKRKSSKLSRQCHVDGEWRH